MESEEEQMTRVICLVIIIVSYAVNSFAEQTIRLAISANFINAMEELSNIFVKKIWDNDPSNLCLYRKSLCHD